MRYTALLCSVAALSGLAVALALGELAPPAGRSAARESHYRPPSQPGNSATSPSRHEASALTPQHKGPDSSVHQVPPGKIWANRRSAGTGSGASGPDDGLTPEERVNIAVYENVNRSVVHITTQGIRGDRLFWMEVPSEGEGSGSVIDRQGHVMTNFHVVDEARAIQVSLFTGESYDAELVGIDATSDVAVLKIDAPAEDLFPVVFGDSTKLRVGQRVFAIGNPFGLERTLTTGIVSSLNRSLPSRLAHRTIKQVIQIDAAINPGSSGGPLLDSRGRVIGVNTAIASKTGESAGVGFAIPINIVARVVPQLIEKGRVLRPDIGIARVYQTERGLLIATVIPGGPAEKAGLRSMTVRTKRQGLMVFEYIDRSTADLIVAVDSQPVKTVDDFLSIIESRQPGDRVTVTVIRDGRRVDVPVTLAMVE